MTTTTSTATDTVQSQDEGQIRELLANRQTAMQQADLERLVAAFAPETVRFGPAPPSGAQEPFILWYRATVGLRKIDGSWQITHEHDSTPFYVDGSFKAAVDLTP